MSEQKTPANIAESPVLGAPEENTSPISHAPRANNHLPSEKEAADKDYPSSGRNDSKLAEEYRDLNKSTSKHKQSINLPHIAPQMNYGDRIFDKQSASTLQKTIVAYSMPKANRFNNDPKYSGEPSYCLDSCFKPNPTKGAGFGFGGKRQFPAWMERNMKENPPPGAYIDSNREGKSKGRTFGISHKYYEKVLIPKQKQASVQAVRKLSPLHDGAR